METKPVISIIMPVFNSATTLLRALKSVEDQTIAVPYEVVIALDRGNDDSLGIATAYATTHPYVRILAPEQRMGQGLSRLKGIEMARGEFIYFMDADDRLAPNCLERLYTTMRETGADCVNCGFYVVSGSQDKVRRFPFHKRKTLTTSQALSAFFRDSWFRGFLWTKMFRRSVSSSRPLLLLGDRKDMFEDVALVCSLLSHAQKVVNIPDPLYYYYKNVASSAMTVHRDDRALQHLRVIALERLFLERSGDPLLVRAFQKHLIRTHWSLLFDLYLDRKYGATKDYQKLVATEWRFVRDMKKPIPIAGRAYEDLANRAFFR